MLTPIKAATYVVAPPASSKHSPFSAVSLLRASRIASLVFLLATASAQTFVGNLNGTHVESTFEGLSTGALPAGSGWTAIDGTAAQVFASTNTAIIGATPYDLYLVQYVTSTPLVPNSLYTLSFRMGYFSAAATGTTGYLFSIGTMNGVNYHDLMAISGGAIAYHGSFSADGSNGEIVSVDYTTGASVSADPIAVRWRGSGTTNGAEYFGFDNAKLTVTAIPEPTSLGALAGIGAFLLGCWHRQRPLSA